MKQEARYTIDGIQIRDREGRVVILRGCNLGGDSKIPFSPPGNPLSYDVSFTGRPFPEDEADAHFARLSCWGFTFLRLVITWEAVEHAGPGIYDEDYLAYLRNILKKAEEQGISVFIDPHQDVWSRWTGGDGAPGWTLEAAGFDLEKLAAAGAAFTMASEGEAYEPMSWGFNYLRYAAATMNTLFFGGNTFAPGRMVDAVPIQDWLQDHFIDAMNHAARRLKDCAAVVGFGIFNEPHSGFIGLESLSGHHRVTSRRGSVPTAFDAIAAASGFPRKVKRVDLAGAIRLPGDETLNPEGVSVFREGYQCPWLEAGVWAVENGVPVVKRDDWFVRGNSGAAVRFGNDFLKPFSWRYAAALSKKHGHYLFFTEGVPFAERASWTDADLEVSEGVRFSLVEAFHWYDGATLLFKKYRPWFTADSETSAPVFGRRSVRRSIRNQLARLASRPRSEGIPAFLGEFGVPFDLDRGKAYRSGGYAKQEAALGAYYDAIDAELLSSTVWNYSASNTHEAGDGWNTEDLSIYSATTGEGRAVRGFSRPYAMAVAGVPLSMRFDRKKRVFSLEWDSAAGCTEIYVPDHWYPDGWRASFGDGNAVLEEKPDSQRLLVRTEGVSRVRVTVAPLGRKG